MQAVVGRTVNRGEAATASEMDEFAPMAFGNVLSMPLEADGCNPSGIAHYSSEQPTQNHRSQQQLSGLSSKMEYMQHP